MTLGDIKPRRHLFRRRSHFLCSSSSTATKLRPRPRPFAAHCIRGCASYPRVDLLIHPSSSQRPSTSSLIPPHPSLIMPANPWIQSNNSGRGVYDARNDSHHAASWLADPRQRSLPTPRFYDDDKLHSSWLHRFHLFRKSLQRRLPSVGALLQSSRVSLTSAPSTPLGSSTPSTDTVRFVLLCGLWYMSSALSSNTGKSILTDFRYPVTLTFVQFGFVAGWCLFFLSPAVRFSTMRRPTKEILKSTFPMGCFQVGGHIFSSMAISRIPVSTVHTIKVSIRHIC